MPDVQEVFRMATQKVRPDPGALERQFQGQRRRSRRRKMGGFAIAAAVLAVGVVIAVTLLNGGKGNPGPAVSKPPAKPAFPIGRVAGLWYEDAGSHLLSIQADGTYAIDDSGTIDTDPADRGTVTVVGRTLVFTSGAGARACDPGQGWVFDPLKLKVDLGATVTMTSTTTKRSCLAVPGGATTWHNAAYRPASYSPPPATGSGTPVTAADEVGVFVLDGGSIIVHQSPNGSFAVYKDGTVANPPDVTGTWRVLPGGRLEWRYGTADPDLGCTKGQTSISRDEVISPGVILETVAGGTCDLGGGQAVIVRLSP